MPEVNAATRMGFPAEKKRRKTMLPFFPLVAGVMGLAIFAFASLYGGTGATALIEAERAALAAPPAEQPEQALASQPVKAAVAGPMAAVAQRLPGVNSAGDVGGVQAKTDGRLFPYLENGKWGYKDPTGVTVIPPTMDGAMEFGKGLYAFAAIRDGNGALRWGLITRMGAWQVQPQYSRVGGFAEDLAAVEKNEKWGYIDLSGKLVIEHGFRAAEAFSCGRAAVRTGSYWGYIDTDGDMAVSAVLDAAGPFANDMAFVSQNGKQYIINKVGEKITTMGNLSGTAYSEGFACIQNENDTYSYFNINRDRAFQQTYANAQNFSDGYAAVCENGRWGYITNKGVLAVNCRFVEAGPYAQSRAAVKDDNGKWGYIDKAGTMIVEPRYDEAQPFFLNYALVKNGKETGVISRDGTYACLYTE